MRRVWVLTIQQIATTHLAKSASQAELTDIVGLQSGEVREKAILAQGFAGRSVAIPQLENLLEQSTFGWVRSHAAFLLGELGADASAPLLKKALNDPFRIEKKHYTKAFNEYPVRIKAHSALKKMGVKFDDEPVLFQSAEPRS